MSKPDRWIPIEKIMEVVNASKDEDDHSWYWGGNFKCKYIDSRLIVVARPEKYTDIFMGSDWSIQNAECLLIIQDVFEISIARTPDFIINGKKWTAIAKDYSLYPRSGDTTKAALIACCEQIYNQRDK